ncbi:hypothetical protein FE257_011932 [Aspergillus nanangensis]|uniref:Prenylated rab acceptor 1 n=1 Tax=Aspergillus nanangensis TaxID=2582783 RepID=A0AAD4CGS5_ASPNN|nr:hypothetical protein FE257_011932 [Aspergillus nanangensis]
MPRWGRPPGARLGRQTRRRGAPWVNGDDGRIEEIDTEDELMLQDGHMIYARQLAGMDLDGRSAWRRQMLDYDEDFDDSESVDGVDYDLYGDADSTVAYAVQLAMKDKEDWLVENALERIRRAQMLGQKNVRLSQRELEALERKRVHTTGTTPQKTNSYRTSLYRDTVQTGSPRNGTNAARKQSSPYTKGEGGGDGYVPWAKASGVQTPPRPPSLRTQLPASSPVSPLQTPYSERFPPSPLARSPVSLKSPTLTRPLPDDPHWMPPLYQVPHSPYGAVDPRRSPGRVPMVPYMNGHPSPYSERQTRPFIDPRRTPAASDDEGELGGSSDEVQIVDVVERKIPATPTRKGGTRRRSKRS